MDVAAGGFGAGPESGIRAVQGVAGHGEMRSVTCREFTWPAACLMSHSYRSGMDVNFSSLAQMADSTQLLANPQQYFAHTGTTSQAEMPVLQIAWHIFT
ncbi:hypothetical protein ACFWJW_22050 [Streptomyces sp. NPDC127097]|uniref:hypothetical protein n=1 Tax=Streptomyces sp. NPDC127097 TaxID=3347136 RepID=UPI003668AE1E